MSCCLLAVADADSLLTEENQFNEKIAQLQALADEAGSKVDTQQRLAKVCAFTDYDIMISKPPVPYLSVHDFAPVGLLHFKKKLKDKTKKRLLQNDALHCLYLFCVSNFN